MKSLWIRQKNGSFVVMNPEDYHESACPPWGFNVFVPIEEVQKCEAIIAEYEVMFPSIDGDLFERDNLTDD